VKTSSTLKGLIPSFLMKGKKPILERFCRNSSFGQQTFTNKGERKLVDHPTSIDQVMKQGIEESNSLFWGKNK